MLPFRSCESESSVHITRFSFAAKHLRTPYVNKLWVDAYEHIIKGDDAIICHGEHR